MTSKTLDYRSSDASPQRQSKSAIVSIVASSLAIVVGLGAYVVIFVVPEQKSFFQGMEMGFVLFFFCAPASIVAAIAAVVSARGAVKQRPPLIVSWSLVTVQAIFWLWLIAASMINASASSASHGAPGGF